MLQRINNQRLFFLSRSDYIFVLGVEDSEDASVIIRSDRNETIKNITLLLLLIVVLILLSISIKYKLLLTL